MPLNNILHKLLYLWSRQDATSCRQVDHSWCLRSTWVPLPRSAASYPQSPGETERNISTAYCDTHCSSAVIYERRWYRHLLLLLLKVAIWNFQCLKVMVQNCASNCFPQFSNDMVAILDWTFGLFMSVTTRLLETIQTLGAYTIILHVHLSLFQNNIRSFHNIMTVCKVLVIITTEYGVHIFYS